jgi:hypothetical protein
MRMVNLILSSLEKPSIRNSECCQGDVKMEVNMFFKQIGDLIEEESIKRLSFI